MINRCKEFAKSFVPPIAVNTARKITSAMSPNKRFSPFKYLPNNIYVKRVLDIGANEGEVTKSALMSFPECHVVCFEPVEETFKVLEQNLEPFKDRVTLYKYAVSDFVGMSTINITSFNPANSLSPQSKFYSHYNPNVKEVCKQKVAVRKLDHFIKEGSPKYDIVKIDVEGHELNVLRGGERFFKDYVDIVIIEISFQRDIDKYHQNYLEIFNTMNSYGYRLINIFDVNNMTYDMDIIDDVMVTQIDCVFRKLN
jgi:FkbM family methyltransferase